MAKDSRPRHRSMIPNAPSWFNLENYPEQMTLYEWSIEIGTRTYVFDPLGEFGTELSNNIKQAFLEGNIDLRQQLQNTFLLTCETCFPAQTSANPITIINYENLKYRATRHGEMVKDGNRILIDTSSSDSAILKRLTSSSTNISVDLSFSDDQLKWAFSEHLSSRRKSDLIEVRKKITKWQKHKLLAYFDLWKWKELVDIGHVKSDRISIENINGWIFPSSDANKLSRTVKSLFSEAFRSEVAISIYRQHLLPG